MSGAQQVLAAGPSVSVKGRWQPPGHRRMHGPDVALAIAFVAPYAALFFAFAVYPIGYALWMGSKPSLYADLIAEVYRRVYLPLMTPALAVVATYALVLAWNDYLYQFVLLASEKHMTAAVMQAQLFDDADPPWNAMMAAAIMYALPPVAIFFALRRVMMAGLTSWWR